MGKGRKWTQEDKQYLEDNWGIISIGTLMEKLDRSKSAINGKVQEMKIGGFLKNGTYITWCQLLTALGYNCRGNGYMMVSWVQNRGFPMHTKRVGNNSFKIVYIDEFWRWAEKNIDLLNFSRFEENLLGKEPEWVKTKRKHDIEWSQKYMQTPWTKGRTVS